MSEPTPEEVLKLLGIDSSERTGRLMIHCPFHHDTDPSAGIYTDTQLFHCFACELTLDMVRFYAKAREITRHEAEDELERALGHSPRRRIGSPTDRAKASSKMERRLRQVITTLPMERHAYYGELADKIIMAHQRGQIGDETLDKAVRGWYTKVDEEMIKWTN